MRGGELRMVSGKWKALLAFGLALGLIIGVMVTGHSQAVGGPAVTPVTLGYGLRLQSDQLFYAVVGVYTDKADAGVGIGLNNSVWLGAHAYFYTDKSLSAFTGLELHIIYPPHKTIYFTPSLPIGFALRSGGTVTSIAAQVTPSRSGQPVGAVLAVTFMMKF